MKTKSVKAKGRRLQNWTRDTLMSLFGFTDEEVRCAIMGESGADVELSGRAKKSFPFAIECKCTERFNIYRAYEQACAHTDDLEPLVIFKSNRMKTLAILDAEKFMEIMARIPNEDTIKAMVEAEKLGDKDV